MMHHGMFGARTLATAAAICSPLLAGASLAGAQITSGPSGGPFASGSVVSVSGSTLDLQSTNAQTHEKTDVTVTLSDSTTYRKIQSTTADAIAVGACVRVNGKGSAAKGIKASTVAITGTSSKDCAQPNFGGRGPGGGNVPQGAGSGSPNTGNGTTPPSIPTTQRRRLNRRGLAFGAVQSVSGDKVVVKAAVLPGRPSRPGSQASGSQGSLPKLKTKNVTVTLSSSTKFTETVTATAADLVVGECASTTGTGDSQAITADSVTISHPVDGTCEAGFVVARPQV